MEDERISRLKEQGFNIAAAMEYIAGDREFYLEIVSDFAKNEYERAAGIKAAYVNKDMKDYQIRVHGLKSAAKTIGADSLSALAFEQEMAAIEDDMPVIDEGIDKLLSVYADTAMRIQKAIAEDECDDGDDNEIDEPVLKQMLVNITRLLVTSEVLEAEKVIRELAGCSFRRKPLKTALAQVIDAIEDYDTDKAQELIKIFIDKGYSM
jgi:HPt (histidine-containing phosphotransfer) domain-containing protein